MKFRGQPFADLADGGRVLVESLRAETSVDESWIVAAVLPGGAVVGRVVADAFDCKVVAVRVDRSTSEPSADIVGAAASELAGRKVVIVDDGVESGTAARAVIGYLRGLSLDALVFAVPICHAQAAADLAGGVDALVAPRRPFTPRALRWEYTTFAPPADDASALQIVQPLGL